MILRFESDGLELIGRLSKPEKIAKGHETGLILCHGFPSLSTGDSDIAKSYYDLADLISEQLGWTVFAICLLYTSPSPRDVEENRMPSSA